MKTIKSVLKILTYIIISITACPATAILVIMSVLICKTAVILNTMHMLFNINICVYMYTGMHVKIYFVSISEIKRNNRSFICVDKVQ